MIFLYGGINDFGLSVFINYDYGFMFFLLLLLLGYFVVGCFLFGLDYVDVFYVGYYVC